MSAPPRHTYIGGSDIAPLLGLSPWRTPLDVWSAKVFPEDQEDKQNSAMRRGAILEPVILGEYENDTGYAVVHRQQFLQSPSFPFMGGTIDGMVRLPLDIRIAIESKSADASKRDEWGEPGSGDIPAYYLPQCMWYMMLTGADECHVPVLFVGRSVEYACYVVKRDDGFIADIADVAKHFWINHVLTGDAPPPQTAADVAKRWPKDSGQVLEVDALIAGEVEALRELESRAAPLLAEIEGIKDTIKLAIGEASQIIHNGRILATYKQQKRKGVDTDAVLAAHPEFAKETSYRVLRINKRKE